MAGEVGFEPTGVLPPLVFKTSAFVRSAIPPWVDYTTFGASMGEDGSNTRLLPLCLRVKAVRR